MGQPGGNLKKEGNRSTWGGGLDWALSQYTENPHVYLGPLFIEPLISVTYLFATLTNIK